MYISSSPAFVLRRRALLCLAWFLAFYFKAEGQVGIVDSSAMGSQVNLGAFYTQSFDSLANTNTSPVPWVNNSTLPGWHAYRERTGAVNMYNPSQGGTPPFGSFGLLGNPDRALGSGLDGGQADALHFGVQFVNSSSFFITGLDVSFDGEQWFYGDSFPGVTESLAFSYQIFGAGQGSLSVLSGWTGVSELAFVSPIDDGEPVRQALNGNLPANRREGIAGSFTEFTLAPGQELWLRWTATNSLSITDHSLAIDNLSVRFTSVPEPATCVTLAGGIALVIALHRRRRRAEYHKISDLARD